MQSSPTLLRIKRKRTDEPLDALVVESKTRRKKSRGASGLFQFAETVEKENFWEDPSLTKDLRTRISTLANGESLVEEIQPDGTPSPRVPSGRRYTIVARGSDRKQLAVMRAGQQDGIGDEDFSMYDAVPETNLSAFETTGHPDPEMDKFLPMLKDYLRMNDSPSNLSTHRTVHEEEYVWDVFYHRPAIIGWSAAANIATVSGLPPVGQYNSDTESDSAGDEDDEDSNTEDFYRNDYPDEDPDRDSSNNTESDEEYPEVSDDEEGDRELNEFLAWRRRH